MKVVAGLYAENDRLERENKELKAKLELYENGVIYSSENEELSKEVDLWTNKYNKEFYKSKKLRSWLEEQEKRAWDEVSSTFGYVLDKLNELEGVNNDR